MMVTPKEFDHATFTLNEAFAIDVSVSRGNLTAATILTKTIQIFSKFAPEK